MTTFKCPDCGNFFDFSPDFTPEGCMLIEKCPFCHTYVTLTSDKIVADPARQVSKKATPDPPDGFTM